MKANVLGSLGLYTLLFIIFGYPIQSFFPFVLGIDSNAINVLFRFITLVICIGVIILQSMSKNDIKIKNIGWFFFIAFWIIYSLRLVYDIQFVGVKYLETDAFFVFSFAFGVSLIPSIMGFKVSTYFDLNKLPYPLLYILFTSNICLTYSILSVNHWNFAEIFLSRANVIIEIGGEGVSIVNPITIGFFGQSLSILSIHLLNFNKDLSKKFRIFLYVCLLVGFLNLLMGASRGPIVTFILLLFFEFYLIILIRKRNSLFYLKIILITVLVLFSSAYFLSTQINDGEFEIVNRFFLTYENLQSGGDDERFNEWSAAWKQIARNPILGDSFVNEYDNSYPHNLFIDVMMSTGLIGMIIFLTLLYFVLRKIRFLIRNAQVYPNSHIFIIFFVSAFLISMTSGGIFTNSMLWIFTSILLGLK